MIQYILLVALTCSVNSVCTSIPICTSSTDWSNEIECKGTEGQGVEKLIPKNFQDSFDFKDERYRAVFFDSEKALLDYMNTTHIPDKSLVIDLKSGGIRETTQKVAQEKRYKTTFSPEIFCHPPKPMTPGGRWWECQAGEGCRECP